MGMRVASSPIFSLMLSLLRLSTALWLSRLRRLFSEASIVCFSPVPFPPVVAVAEGGVSERRRMSGRKKPVQEMNIPGPLDVGEEPDNADDAREEGVPATIDVSDIHPQ